MPDAYDMTHPTLKDWAKALDPQGVTPIIAEMLSIRNDMLDDMVMIEGNLPTGHRTTRRTELPEVDWIGINEGVKPSKSALSTYEVHCGLLSGFAEMDVNLGELGGRAKEMRAIEDEGFLQSMQQKAGCGLVYGSATENTKAIDGFFKYLDSDSPECAPPDSKWREQVISAGGTTGPLTSMLLVGWDRTAVHGVFPNKTKAGFSKIDHGRYVTTKTDEQGNLRKLTVWGTEYKWLLGLCVRDPRYVIRIANIPVTALAADPEKGGVNLIELMVQASEKMRAVGGGASLKFYCNTMLRTRLRLQQANSKNVSLTIDQVGGKAVMSFDGIPVRICNELINAEAPVQFP